MLYLNESSATEGLVAEVVTLSQICGAIVPSAAADFWMELAIWRGIADSGNAASNAKSVLESFGEAWDDDYLDDDQSPSLAALEAVHGLVRSHFESTRTGQASTDDDDEDEQISAQDRDISAETSLWNILTVVDHIRKDRLNLNPEWQRSFVWKPRKQKALIESLLLGLPIPSFLIYKDRETGKMSVIDGRQRLETISHFTADKEEKGEARLRFRTFGSTQEGWKQGQFLNPAAGKFYQDLPDKFRTQFDTRNLQVAVLDVPLDHLYQIFKRYNTGSVALNAAEIRNAVFQSSPLHTMMFRLGGEHRDLARYQNQDEQRVGEDLRGIMKGKQSRYGAYDFIGRFLAYRYESTGSVAKAIFSFMAKHHKASVGEVEKYRAEFINAFTSTGEWYEYPLTEPRVAGVFHALLATIQMVSTSHALEAIDGVGTRQEAVQSFIRTAWRPFAAKVLQEKQNSTNFWKFQREWNDAVVAAAQAQ